MPFKPSFDQQFTRKALRSKYTQSTAAEVRQSRRQKASDALQKRASKTRAATQSAGLATPLEQLQDWLNDSGGSADALNLAYANCVAARKLRQGEVCHYRPSLTALMLCQRWCLTTTLLQVVLSLPGDAAVTQADVAACPACSQLAEGRSELVGLALWLVSQRAQVRALHHPCQHMHHERHKTCVLRSRCAFRLHHGMQAVQPQWQLLVSSLPEKVDTPVLWSPNEQTELLQGSAALQEAQSRMQALDAEWQSIAEQMKTSSQGPAQGVLCSLYTTFWNHKLVRKMPCLSVAAHEWRILHACHTVRDA